MMNRFEIVREKLKVRLNDGSKYSSLAEDHGTSKGAMWKFINTNYVPKDKRVRRSLLKLSPNLHKKTNWRYKYKLLSRYILKRWKNERDAKESSEPIRIDTPGEEGFNLPRIEDVQT